MIGYQRPPVETVTIEEACSEAYKIESSASGTTPFWAAVVRAIWRTRSGGSLAERQLANMTGLEVNWAEEGREPPNACAKSLAATILKISDLMAIETEYVTASAEGGVAICFRRSEIYADIECFNSGEIWALVSDRVNPPETWQVKTSKKEIQQALRRIDAFIEPRG